MLDANIYDFEVDLSDKNHGKTKEIELIGFDKKVLEFGCATGSVSKVLKDRGCCITGVEIDDKAAKKAEKYCEKIIVGDIENLDFAKLIGDEKYDVVLFGDVLEHLKAPKKILMDTREIIGDDGYIVISVPNIAHWSVRLDLLCGEFNYQKLGILDYTHLRFFTKKTIINLLNSSGYILHSIDEVRRYVDLTKISNIMKLKGLDDDNIKNLLTIFKDSSADVQQYVIKAVPSTEYEYLKKLRTEIEIHEDTIKGLEDTIKGLEDTIKSIDDEISTLKQQNNDLEMHLQQKEEYINELITTIHAKDAETDTMKKIKNKINRLFY